MINFFSFISTVLNFLKKHWLPCTLALTIVGAFFLGKYSRPAHVEVQEHTVTVEHTNTVTVAAEAKVEWRDRVITRVVTVEKRPDGTEIKTEKTTDADKSTLKTDMSSTTTRVADVSTKHEKITISDDAPRLHLNILVGYSATKWDKLPNIAGEHLAIGVQADLRVFGPVTVGAWVLSTGAAGGSVGVVF